MNKKAISPLIATVLLIGFAVALAAVVMTWGSQFIKSTTEQTGATAEATLACAKMDLDIKPTCETTYYSIASITNEGPYKITDIMLRYYDENDEFVCDFGLSKGYLRGPIAPYYTLNKGIMPQKCQNKGYRFEEGKKGKIKSLLTIEVDGKEVKCGIPIETKWAC